MTALAWLIPLLPFLAFGLIVFFGRRLPGQGASVAIGALLAAAGFSLLLFFRLLGGAEPIHSTINWLVLGQQPLALGIQVDALTAVMLLVVTVVGSMIFIYSVGYMHGDPRYPRFFAYLSLFAASMLLLVLADNFLFLYVGWELVGLCSYLLIGFWFERPAAARASLTAFITTPVGDVFFFAGILLVFFNLGTLGLGQTSEAVESGQLSAARLAARRGGGPHTGLRPDPRRLHGVRRRLPGGPTLPHLLLLARPYGARGGRLDLRGQPASSSSPSPRPTIRRSRWSPGSAGSAPSWRRRSPWCRTTSSA